MSNRLWSVRHRKNLPDSGQLDTWWWIDSSYVRNMLTDSVYTPRSTTPNRRTWRSKSFLFWFLPHVNFRKLNIYIMYIILSFKTASRLSASSLLAWHSECLYIHSDKNKVESGNSPFMGLHWKCLVKFNRIKPCPFNQEKEKNSVNQENPWFFKIFLSECNR